jgi:hypothetical protein
MVPHLDVGRSEPRALEFPYTSKNGETQRTSDAIGGSIEVACGRIGVRELAYKGKRAFPQYFARRPLIIETCPESCSWGDVIDVLLDPSRYMILFTSDIARPRVLVFPDIEIGHEKLFNFGNGGVKLDPL